MTAEVVGPLPTIRFRDGSKQAYEVPRDTCDPRWTACTDHHPACNCREAELSESINEYKAMLAEAEQAAREVLAGHPTFVYEETPDGGSREVGCACTGCQIARKAHLIRCYEADQEARNATYGLSGWQAECGWYWEVCTSNTRDTYPDICAQAQGTRDRGVFHEHLVGSTKKPVLRSEFGEEVPF